MNYKSAIEYLENHINWEAKSREELRKPTMNEDIRSFTEILYDLDDPHLSYPTVHIGGTAGKGSTATMLANILTDAGYKTGLYTSPHLFSYTERIKVDNNPISEEEFASIMELLQEKEDQFIKRDDMRTVFELLTILAFIHFKNEGVDIAIVEAGLGGKYDSTIVVDPVLSILTPIDLDHTDVLGESLEEIASDKSFIMREGGITLTEQWSDIVREEINRRGAEINNRVYYLKENFNFTILGETMDKDGVSFSIESGTIRTGMTGFHQAVNGGLAVVGASLLTELGFDISVEAIKSGLLRSRMSGRFEIVSDEPMIILDGAHNPLGMKWLAESLVQIGIEDFTLIIGMNGNKEVSESIISLLPLAKRVIVVSSSHPLAMDEEMLASVIESMGQEAGVCDDIERALLMGIKDPPILITGSLYLVADYIGYLKESEQ